MDHDDKNEKGKIAQPVPKFKTVYAERKFVVWLYSKYQKHILEIIHVLLFLLNTFSKAVILQTAYTTRTFLTEGHFGYLIPA